jgi:hypothetical protein
MLCKVLLNIWLLQQNTPTWRVIAGAGLALLVLALIRGVILV